MSSTTTLKLDYNSPQESFQNALNFNSSDQKKLYNYNGNENSNDNSENSTNNNNNNENDTTTSDSIIKRMLAKLNNSKYLYPSIAIFISTLYTIVIAIQTNYNSIRLIAILILIIFIIYTIYLFKT